MGWFRDERDAQNDASAALAAFARHPVGRGKEAEFERFVALGRSVDSATRYALFNSIAVAAQHDPKVSPEQRAFLLNEIRRAFEIDGKMPD